MRVLGLATLFALSAAARASSTPGDVDGLYALVQRRIPSHNKSFNFVLKPDNSTLDTFTLSDSDCQGDAQIDIQCTSISACARGLYT